MSLRKITPKMIEDAVSETNFYPTTSTLTTTQTLTALDFTNKLVIGHSYKARLYISATSSSGVFAFRILETDRPSLSDKELLNIEFTTRVRAPFEVEFVATGTSLEVQLIAGGASPSISVQADGTELTRTNLKVTKLPYNIVEGTL